MLWTLICRQGAKVGDILTRCLGTSEHGFVLNYWNVPTMKQMSLPFPGYIQRANVSARRPHQPVSSNLMGIKYFSSSAISETLSITLTCKDEDGRFFW
jgi:hypothetical protein